MFYILNRILSRSRNNNKPDIYTKGSGRVSRNSQNANDVSSVRDPDECASSICEGEDDKNPLPTVTTITFNKVKDSIGLSIVSIKGERQKQEAVYIKAIIPNGGADLDGRLEVGDQLLGVDGKSLVGLSQDRAARCLMDTGRSVTLVVAKGGARYHGLMPLLSNPSPELERRSEKRKQLIGDPNHSSDQLNANFLKAEPSIYQINNSWEDNDSSNVMYRLNKACDRPDVHKTAKKQPTEVQPTSPFSNPCVRLSVTCPSQQRDNGNSAGVGTLVSPVKPADEPGTHDLSGRVTGSTS